MARIATFLYGVVCYAIFFATFLYAIGFIGNIWVPKSIDSAPQTSLGIAIVINLGLMLVFALQHSVMARPGFKKWWTKFVPEPAERSTYVLFSSLALIALFYFWQPMGGIVWDIQNGAARSALLGLYALGWALVLYSTFLINHFDLFGLRQVYLRLVDTPYSPLRFKTPSLYKVVRHPLYVGWIVVFWAAPTMTIAHLVFALTCTGYILMAIPLEERDLIRSLGERYAQYRRQVPMLIPSLRRRKVIEPQSAA